MINAKRFELKTGETNIPVVDFLKVIDRDVYNALGKLPVDFNSLLGMLGLNKVEDLLNNLFKNVEDFFEQLTDGMLDKLLSQLPPWVKELLESLIGQTLSQLLLTENGQNLFNQLPNDIKEKIVANILMYTGIKLPTGNCNLNIGTLTNDVTVKDDLAAAALAGILMTSVGDCGNYVGLLTKILNQLGDTVISRLATAMLINYFAKTNNLEALKELSKLTWFKDVVKNFPFLIDNILSNIQLPKGWTMQDLLNFLDIIDPNWVKVDYVVRIRKLQAYRSQEFFINYAKSTFPDTSKVVKLRNTVTDLVIAFTAFKKINTFSDRFLRISSA